MSQITVKTSVRFYINNLGVVTDIQPAYIGILCGKALLAEEFTMTLPPAVQNWTDMLFTPLEELASGVTIQLKAGVNPGDSTPTFLALNASNQPVALRSLAIQAEFHTQVSYPA